MIFGAGNRNPDLVKSKRNTLIVNRVSTVDLTLCHLMRAVRAKLLRAAGNVALTIGPKAIFALAVAAADEILNTLMDARADRAAHDAVRKQARRLQPPIAQDAALEIRNRVGVVFSESLCRSGRVAEFAGLSNT